MDKALQMQLQIRQNADEISSALKEIKTWESKMKTKKSCSIPPRKRVVPQRSAGGTVPLRSFAPAPLLASPALTPASIIDNALQNVNDSFPIPVSVPKAKGHYTEKDLEEFERDRGNNEFKIGNFSNAVKAYTKCLGLKVNVTCLLISI
jgi:hypothetical protein